MLYLVVHTVVRTQGEEGCGGDAGLVDILGRIVHKQYSY
jgi:hypothetical protein